MKKIRTGMGLLLMSLAILAGIAEVLARLMEPRAAPVPQATEVALTPPSERLLFFRYHPILGYDGIPNMERDFWNRRVRLNSRGERSPEVPVQKPQGTKRVVLLGDSQVWGFGAGDNETLGALLQIELNKRSPHQVISLAAIGYSTDQELLKFLLDGLQYRPDYVVMVFFANNDLWELVTNEAWGVPKPRFLLKDGEICLTDIPVPRSSGWPESSLESLLQIKEGSGILQHSAFMHWLGTRKLRPSLTNLFGIFSAGIRSPADGKEVAERLKRFIPCIQFGRSTAGVLPDSSRIPLYKAVVKKVKDSVESQGGKLLMVTVPNKDEYEAGFPSDAYRNVLSTLIELGLPPVDLLQLGRKANVPVSEMYEMHLHVPKVGMQLVAEELSRNM